MASGNRALLIILWSQSRLLPNEKGSRWEMNIKSCFIKEDAENVRHFDLATV